MSEHTTPGLVFVGQLNDQLGKGPPGEIAIRYRVNVGDLYGPLKRRVQRNAEGCLAIVSPHGGDGDVYPEATKANAEAIVLRWNQHDALTAKAALLEEAVAALKSALWLMGKDSDRAIIKDPPHSPGQVVQALRDVLSKVREKGV